MTSYAKMLTVRADLSCQQGVSFPVDSKLAARPGSAGAQGKQQQQQQQQQAAAQEFMVPSWQRYLPKHVMTVLVHAHTQLPCTHPAAVHTYSCCATHGRTAAIAGSWLQMVSVVICVTS
jgi:hypothetical protein